jgi:hypothetical protein
MIGSIPGSAADIERRAVPEKPLCSVISGEQLEVERVV